MVERKIYRFDLQKAKTLSKYDPVKLLNMLYKHYKRNDPKLNGLGFLKNAQDFFLDKNVDILYRAQYVDLAGRRSYQQYKDLKYTHLDLTYYPDLNINAITYNPLLTIKNNKIYFKYEE